MQQNGWTTKRKISKIQTRKKQIQSESVKMLKSVRNIQQSNYLTKKEVTHRQTTYLLYCSLDSPINSVVFVLVFVCLGTFFKSSEEISLFAGL